MDAGEIYRELKASVSAAAAGHESEQQAGVEDADAEQDVAAAGSCTSADFMGQQHPDQSLSSSFDGLSPYSQPSAADASPPLPKAASASSEAAGGVAMRELPRKQRQDADDDDLFLPTPAKVGKKKARNRDSSLRKEQAGSRQGVACIASPPQASQEDFAASSLQCKTPPRGWGAAGAAGGSAGVPSSSLARETLEEIQLREAQEQRRKDEAARADLRGSRKGAKGSAAWPAVASSFPPVSAEGADSANGALRPSAALAFSPPPPPASSPSHPRAQWNSRTPADASPPSDAAREAPRDVGKKAGDVGKKAGRHVEDDDLFWGNVPGKSKQADKAKALQGGGAAKTAARVVAETQPSAGARGGWVAGSPVSGPSLSLPGAGSFSLMDFAPKAKPSRKGKARREQQAEAEEAQKTMVSRDGQAQPVTQTQALPLLPSLASIQAEEEKRVDRRRLHKTKIKNKVRPQHCVVCRTHAYLCILSSAGIVHVLHAMFSIGLCIVALPGRILCGGALARLSAVRDRLQL